MIPKIIHYCWFGPNEKSELELKCIDSWKKYCNEYQLIEWNEHNFDINSNPYVREAYESKRYAFVTDYVRLYALYTYGGVYMDTDVEVIKNLDWSTILAALVTGFLAFLGTYLVAQRNNKKDENISDKTIKSDMESLFTNKIEYLLNYFQKENESLKNSIDKLTKENSELKESMIRIKSDNQEMLESNKRLLEKNEELMKKNEELNNINKELIRKNEELINKIEGQKNN